MSKKAEFKDLLEAGVHFGHLKRKWNPAMAPYIFNEQKGIHVIDLNKTIAHLEQACAAARQIAASGKKILFVATKKQAKQIIEDKVKEINMPYVVERWSGGMLTNFGTTRKSIRKMASIDKMKTDGTWETLNKRERLFKTRQRDKMEKNFGSIVDMTRQPAAIFIVDILKEKIALKEASRLGITTFAMVDTNVNPKLVDFPIPANDDASKSIAIIVDQVVEAIKEGLEARKANRAANKESEEKTEVKEEKEVKTPKAKVAVKKEAPATKEDDALETKKEEKVEEKKVEEKVEEPVTAKVEEGEGGNEEEE